jgi:DNA-binding MarR family transcriptional regulator
MEELTDKQQEVLTGLIACNEPVTPKELALFLGYTESAYIFTQLKSLLRKGYITKTGTGRYTKYRAKRDYYAD